MISILTMKNLWNLQGKKQWIDEEAAAAKLFRKPATLRMLVLSGKLQISYRENEEGTYQYSERDIEIYLKNHTVYRN